MSTSGDHATPSFNVTVQPSQRQFSVQADETLLAAAIRHGVGLPYGCKDGACGSCKCRMLAGRVRHGPHQEKALSAAEEAAGMVLSCCASPLSDVLLESRQVTLAGAAAVRKMPTRVLALTRYADDVIGLQLQLPASESLPYLPGQYVDILLADGRRRSYSMASAQALPVLPPGSSTEASGTARAIELHIRHLPGGLFTEQVFGKLKVRDILRIEGPFGSFQLHPSDQPMILLASGTGFAPIKALLQQLMAQTATPPRPAWLYWGGRRRPDLYQHDWALQAQQRLPGLRYVPVLSDALPEDGWTGRSGLVHQAVLQDHPDLSGFQVYACGVPAMVTAAQTDFVGQAGLPADQFFADAFTSEADRLPA